MLLKFSTSLLELLMCIFQISEVSLLGESEITCIIIRICELITEKNKLGRVLFENKMNKLSVPTMLNLPLQKFWLFLKKLTQGASLHQLQR